MSELTYSGITLPMPSTASINFEPYRPDDRQVDFAGTTATFDVACPVSASLFASQFPGLTSTEVMGHVEHALNLPRRPFSYKVNGIPLVTITPPDLKLGPFPGPVRVTQVGGSETYLIQFRLTTTFIQCVDGTTPNPLWVSHRFSEIADLDSCAMTTRTRRGTIFSRADMRVNADDLRGAVAAGTLLHGFRRLSSNYVLSSDGTRLDYVYRDEEVWAQPPEPAFEAEGEYIQSSANGALMFGECRLRLKGAKPTSKAGLIEAALTIAMARLKAADVNADANTGSILAIGAIREVLYANEIEVRVRTQLKAITSRQGRGPGKAPISLDRFGQLPLGSEPGRPPADPGIRGSAALGLVSNYLQDPCLQNTSLVANGPGASQLVGTSPVPEAAVTISTVPPDDMMARMKTTSPGIFTEYQINTVDDVNSHSFQVPVADPSAPAEVVTTAGTTLRRVIEIEATKLGYPPELPDPRGIDLNLALLRARFGTPQVEPDGDGFSLRYKVTARYEYAAKDGSKVAVGPGVPPWVDLRGQNQAAMSTFQPTQFRTGIIDVPGMSNGPTLNFLFGGATLTTGGGGGLPTTGPGN